MSFVLRRTAAVLRKGARVLEKYTDLQKERVQKVMTQYDMVISPDEPYYAQQYLHWILLACKENFSKTNPFVLDVGCGQGRLTIPMAQWAVEGQVIGIDFTPAAIASAKQYASKQKIKNINFYQADILEYIENIPENTFDIVIMTEVSFFMPKYKTVIKRLHSILKPNGLFVGAFWSQYYRLLQCIKNRCWDGAETIVERKEGCWGDDPVWLSWDTAQGVSDMLRDFNFSNIKLRGIGIASGIEGDSLSSIVQPSLLREEERLRLMEIEISLAEKYVDCGRYILAIAEKNI